MSAQPPQFSLIVPAFNEVRSIAATLGEIQDYFEHRACSFEVIVSADGTDGTRECVAKLAQHDPRIQVMGSIQRLGKGRGIRQGVARARGGLIGFMDADNKTPITELDRLLPWFDRGYDVVMGSRAQADSRIEVRQSLIRRLGSRAFGMVMHGLLGMRQLRDTQCGFKFFRAAVAKDLFARQQIDGYMFDVEVLYLADRSRYRIKEVGVRWRDDGDSRLQLVAGNWRNLVDLLRVRWARPGLRSPG